MSNDSLNNLRAGKWHIPTLDGCLQQAAANIDKVHEYNKLRPSDMESRDRMLREILNPNSGWCMIQQPMMIEYGINTTIGEGTFINFGVTILDTAEVTIEENVQIGPNCQIITVGHPVDDYEMRRDHWEIAHPVVLEESVWLGAGVIVLPGVTIGKCAVVGAGSVVTKDVPPFAIVRGVPARVVRYADPEQYERSELPDDVTVTPWEI
ncbi:MAG: sugar O-acetyltransferase [Corynebacterium sp.]|nr:sugar O-acetyltransferase [Corynebacterium sp.]